MVAVSRYQVNLLHKLSKISKKDRQKHINSWPIEAFRDIKGLCKKICHNKKVTQKTIKKIRKQKNLIRTISKAPPKQIKKILAKQSGAGIFTAIATGILPFIVDQITKLVSK